MGLRLGLRLGASGSPPLPVSPRDLSPSAPLLPLSERTPLLEFCNVPGAGALLDVCKNSWSGRPSSFFPNSRSGRPSPILLSSRCGRPSSHFANSQSGRPSHPNVYNTRTGIPVSAKKTPARIPQSAKFNYPRAPNFNVGHRTRRMAVQRRAFFSQRPNGPPQPRQH